MTPFILMVLLYAPTLPNGASVMTQVHTQEFADGAACSAAAVYIEQRVVVNQKLTAFCLPKVTVAK